MLPSGRKTMPNSALISFSGCSNYLNNVHLAASNSAMQTLWPTFFPNQIPFSEHNWPFIANNYLQQQYLQQQKQNCFQKSVDSFTKRDNNNSDFFDNCFTQHIDRNNEKLQKQKKHHSDQIQQSMIQNALALFMNSSPMLNYYKNNSKKKSENGFSSFLAPIIFQNQLKRVAQKLIKNEQNVLSIPSNLAVLQTATIEKYLFSEDKKFIDTLLQSATESNNALSNEKVNVHQKTLRKKHYNVRFFYKNYFLV